MKSPSTSPPVAYLERYAETGGPVERIPLVALPFIIGRGENAGHTIYSSKVSREHAAIVLVGDRFAVRDLDSTNGTFVNGQRATERTLEDGDIIHVAHVEFSFHAAPAPAEEIVPVTEPVVERTQILEADRPESIIRGTRLLQEMMRGQAFEILYQPIVELSTRQIMGYEALCRGTHPGLSRNPAILLRLAEQCGLAIELCQMLGRLAVIGSRKLPAGARVFVNLHAYEFSSPGLSESLKEMRALVTEDHPVVLEIPESSVADLKTMAENRKLFMQLGFETAYDDFGAGQGHLMELTEMPPDFLKVDKGMLVGIETAKSRQEMVGALLGVVRGLGIRVIAEGIETEELARLCQDLGCDLGQGYLFGRPA